MARSVEEIQTAIKADIRAYSSLDDFEFPEDGGSQTSVFNIIIFVVSAAMFTFEVIADNLQSVIQGIADTAPSGNESWLRRQILNFQYTDTVTINTTDSTADNYFVPVYDPVTPANRIVTQAVVSDGTAGSVIIKVAKGTAGSLTPLTAPESTALSNYYYGTSSTEGIGFAGVRATFVSLDSDRLYVDADIYYLGQYVEATVKTNVIAAIDAFLATFADDNFGGNVYMIRLVDAIQAVEGVSRVTLTEIKARPNATPFVSAAVIDIQGVYTTISGHIIGEDDSGNTLTDTITMIEETL
jgi:hypothetical protein